MTAPRHPRPLDHCVLPVPDLESAQQQLARLGFTVAPRGVHPFGTENACVYFADNTFLEPLAIDSRETCEATALKGNVFTARDQVHRFRNSDNGFSAVVFGTSDADGDHKAFVRAGISAGRKLTFSRRFIDGAGKRDKASFKLAFAADLRAPDAFFFTCERINVPAVDRSALQAHANGTARIKSVVMSETNPTDFQYPLQEIINEREVDSHSFGMEIAAANAVVEVLTPAGFAGFFGTAASNQGRGLCLEAVVFGVRDMAATEAFLEAQDIGFRHIGDRLVIDRARGQGAIFAFEAQ